MMVRGWHVLRVSNHDIVRNIDDVMDMVAEALGSPRSPIPPEGG